jgi:hypothetical protein
VACKKGETMGIEVIHSGGFVIGAGVLRTVMVLVRQMLRVRKQKGYGDKLAFLFMALNNADAQCAACQTNRA